MRRRSRSSHLASSFAVRILISHPGTASSPSRYSGARVPASWSWRRRRSHTASDRSRGLLCTDGEDIRHIGLPVCSHPRGAGRPRSPIVLPERRFFLRSQSQVVADGTCPDPCPLRNPASAHPAAIQLHTFRLGGTTMDLAHRKKRCHRSTSLHHRVTAAHSLGHCRNSFYLGEPSGISIYCRAIKLHAKLIFF